MRKLVWLGVLGALMLVGRPAQAQSCPGDCDGNRMVIVNELITCVNIALTSLPASACPACDVSGDGTVIVNELISAVNVALSGQCPTGEGVCGDGEMNVAGETCDDHNNVGGDGCAANCTIEVRRETNLDPTVSRATVQFRSLPLPLNLSGMQALTGGRPRDTAVMGPGNVQLFAPGEFPVVVKVADVRFNPIELSGLGCACVRGFEVPEFGPGVAGVGVVGCGEQGLTDVDFLVTQDHDTTPGAPGNSGSENGLPDDAECDDTFDLGGGIIYDSCQEGVGESCNMEANIHGVCWSPRHITFSGGQAPRGSVLIRNNTAIGVLQNTVPRSCEPTCNAPDFGPDCMPCTDDDLEKGIPQISPTTSGTASVIIFDANNIRNFRIGDGLNTCSGPCIGRVTGEVTDCDSLEDENAGLTGSLVTAFPGLDQQLGDAAITTTLKSMQ